MAFLNIHKAKVLLNMARSCFHSLICCSLSKTRLLSTENPPSFVCTSAATLKSQVQVQCSGTFLAHSSLPSLNTHLNFHSGFNCLLPNSEEKCQIEADYEPPTPQVWWQAKCCFALESPPLRTQKVDVVLSPAQTRPEAPHPSSCVWAQGAGGLSPRMARSQLSKPSYPSAALLGVQSPLTGSCVGMRYWSLILVGLAINRLSHGSLFGEGPPQSYRFSRPPSLSQP